MVSPSCYVVASLNEVFQLYSMCFHLYVVPSLYYVVSSLHFMRSFYVRSLHRFIIWFYFNIFLLCSFMFSYFFIVILRPYTDTLITLTDTYINICDVTCKNLIYSYVRLDPALQIPLPFCIGATITASINILTTVHCRQIS